MRYRRYYTQRNKDGSRSVVSVGPVATSTAAIGSFFIKFVFFILAFAWPVVIVSDNLHGWAAWLVGVPSELIWLGFLGVIAAAMKKS